MKKQLVIIVCTLILSCMSAAAFSQWKESHYRPDLPKWISDKGYWVVESNLKTPKSAIIYFYNNSNTLIYKEQVEGVKLDLDRRRVLKRLKNVLEQAVTAWEKQPVVKENQMLVATALKKHPIL